VDRIQLKKSGLFEPMNKKEVAFLSREMQETMRFFSELPLCGEVSLISSLKRMEQDLEPRRAFRKKLKKQSKFVRNEYFRRLRILTFNGSKEGLLKNILNELKDLEDQPSAVQFEFQKKQKAASMTKDTASIKEEVMNSHEKRTSKYSKEILKNLDSFGGKKVQSKYGKIPEAALEFIDWFEGRKNFAEMDSAIKKLPEIISDRKKLYKKRDKILENALPKDRDKLTRKTNLLRRHELQAYLPELEKQVRTNSIQVAEYMTTLIGARENGVAMFQAFEQDLNIQRFKLLPTEEQVEKIKWLNSDIKDRGQTIKDYFELPSYLRKDQLFIARNAIDRDKMLMDALEQRNREEDSPFGVAGGRDLDRKDTEKVTDNIDSADGQKAISDVVTELSQEGQLQAAKIQEETYNKIFGTAKRAKDKNITQKESYKTDLKDWVRLDQNVKDESDVTNERERAKWRYIEAADEAYDLGKAVTSGGEIHKLQTINATQLKTGNSKVHEQIQDAKYGEHVQVLKEDGTDTRDPLEMIERMSEMEVMKLVLAAITKLGRNHMGLDTANTAMLQNSTNIQKEMANQIVGREFSHLAANNNKYLDAKAA